VGGSGPPYDVDGYSTHDLSLGGDTGEPFSVAETPRPWFLKPWVLALWGLTVLLLIATIIYGLVILATGNGGGPPATTLPSSTRPSSSTPSSTLPTTIVPTPPETTTPELLPPPESTQQWTPQQHPHRHWWNGNVPQIPGLPSIHVPGVNP